MGKRDLKYIKKVFNKLRETLSLINKRLFAFGAALLEDGISLHSCIAQNLLGKEYEVPSRIEPVFKSVQCVLGDMHHVRAIETYVAHKKLHYKGVVDCIASYR